MDREEFEREVELYGGGFIKTEDIERLHADEIDPSFTYHEPGEDTVDFSKPRPFRPELYLLRGLTGFKG